MQPQLFRRRAQLTTEFPRQLRLILFETSNNHDFFRAGPGRINLLLMTETTATVTAFAVLRASPTLPAFAVSPHPMFYHKRQQRPHHRKIGAGKLAIQHTGLRCGKTLRVLTIAAALPRRRREKSSQRRQGACEVLFLPPTTFADVAG